MQAEGLAAEAEIQEHVQVEEVVVQLVCLRWVLWEVVVVAAMPDSLLEEAGVEGQAEQGCDWEAQAVPKPCDRL